MLRSRYRAEARFPLLRSGCDRHHRRSSSVVVLTDIILKGYPAFTQHTLRSQDQDRARRRSIRKGRTILPIFAPATSRPSSATRLRAEFLMLKTGRRAVSLTTSCRPARPTICASALWPIRRLIGQTITGAGSDFRPTVTFTSKASVPRSCKRAGRRHRHAERRPRVKSRSVARPTTSPMRLRW